MVLERPVNPDAHANRPVLMVAGGNQNLRREFTELKVGWFSILSTLVKFWGLYFPPMLLLSEVKCIVGKVADLTPHSGLRT